MRLFVAVNFNGSVKDRLCGSIERLKADCVSGRFTRRENLHLTLAFIGETNRAEDARLAMAGVRCAAFDLRLSGIGRFRRPGGDIWWLGVEKIPELSAVHEALYAGLTGAGFALENREFRPHLTLGRDVVPSDGFDQEAFGRAVPEIIVPVTQISLMRSDRPGGRLTYTEIFTQPLGAPTGRK